MTDTADHRARCHQLADHRRAQGKPSWDATLNLVDVFHDDDLTFAAKRDTNVRRIKALQAYKTAATVVEDHPESDDYYNASDLLGLVDELAEVEDVEDFDCVWSTFYDWADIARIWVKTF